MDELNNILSKFGGAEQMWTLIKSYGAKAGREVTKTVLELFYVMKSPNTGMIDKTLIGAALAYQLLPEDLMPRSKFGILGFLDNGVTLAFAYNRVKKLVTPQIENQVDVMLNQWFGPSYEQYENQNVGDVPIVIGNYGNSPSLAPASVGTPGWNTSSRRWDNNDVVID